MSLAERLRRMRRRIFGIPVTLDRRRIGTVQEVHQDATGLHVTARIDDEQVKRMLQEGIGSPYSLERGDQP